MSTAEIAPPTKPATEAEAVAAIMDRVRQWSSPARIALARRILESLEAQPDPAPPPTRPLRGVSAEAATGMLRTDQPLHGVPAAAVAGRYRGEGPPPTDEECQQILEEELWKKYGS